MATTNYLSETDWLAEAGQILCGQTRKVATLEHLKAMQQLVTQARQILVEEFGEDGRDASDIGQVADWLAAAEKVSR